MFLAKHRRQQWFFARTIDWSAGFRFEFSEFSSRPEQRFAGLNQRQDLAAKFRNIGAIFVERLPRRAQLAKHLSISSIFPRFLQTHLPGKIYFIDWIQFLQKYVEEKVIVITITIIGKLIKFKDFFKLTLHFYLNTKWNFLARLLKFSFNGNILKYLQDRIHHLPEKFQLPSSIQIPGTVRRQQRHHQKLD